MSSGGVIIALLLVTGVVLSAGCIANPFAANTSGKGPKISADVPVETPTLPDQYIAKPVGTPDAGSGGSPTPVYTNRSLPLITGLNTTINGTGITGDSNTTNSTNSITINGTIITIPVAQFTSNITMGFVPVTIQFTDSSTSLPTSWSWDFGDGNSSTLQNPYYTYYSGGQYAVILTTTNAAGSGNFTRNVSVYSPGFSVLPGNGPAPLTVTFTDAGKGYPQPTAWFWDFGDGRPTSNQRNITHQFQSSGIYDVKFRITSQAGIAWVNKSAAVTVV